MQCYSLAVQGCRVDHCQPSNTSVHIQEKLQTTVFRRRRGISKIKCHLLFEVWYFLNINSVSDYIK